MARNISLRKLIDSMCIKNNKHNTIPLPYIPEETVDTNAQYLVRVEQAW